MDADAAVRARQALVQPPGIFQAVYLLPEIHPGKIDRIKRRRVAEDQHRPADAAAAELHSLLDIGYGQILRAQLV